ncbi:MAG: hypothetical protein AAFZ87_03315, partial [Planctomycetota bacterium]
RRTVRPRDGGGERPSDRAERFLARGSVRGPRSELLDEHVRAGGEDRVVERLRSAVGRLEPAELGVLLARRITIVDRGLRALGLAAALGWVLVTFALSTALPGADVATVAGLLQTSLWFTLLQALGLLVLPTPSRAATRAADAWCLEGSDTSRADLDAALVALDELGDRELDREPFVERWFHPVASVASRRSALEDPKRETAPWHVARAAVYLALVGLSPLARLVHGSVGRPDVWVLLPTDG